MRAFKEIDGMTQFDAMNREILNSKPKHPDLENAMKK